MRFKFDRKKSEQLRKNKNRGIGFDEVHVLFEQPYYLEPEKRGKKPYALLREALKRSGRAGLARFVVHTKQHLAALLVTDSALLLNTLRFADEIQAIDDLDLPGEGAKAEGLSAREIETATRLIDDMSEPWRPERYRDTYRDDLMKRIEEKIAAGQTKVLTEVGDAPSSGTKRESAQIIDLVALLKKSISSRDGKKTSSKSASVVAAKKIGPSKASKATTKPTTKKAAATKRAVRVSAPASRRKAA